MAPMNNSHAFSIRLPMARAIGFCVERLVRLTALLRGIAGKGPDPMATVTFVTIGRPPCPGLAFPSDAIASLFKALRQEARQRRETLLGHARHAATALFLAAEERARRRISEIRLSDSAE